VVLVIAQAKTSSLASGIATCDPMDVFAPIRSLDVRSLAGPALEVLVPAGTHLVEEGQLIGTFFVIRSGSAELRQGRVRLRTLGTGDCFGEIDPVIAMPQRFTVVASSPTRLLTFSAFGIGRLCAAMPGARGRILQFLPDDVTG
jgi:CRP-like cAMP-binding protein